MRNRIIVRQAGDITTRMDHAGIDLLTKEQVFVARRDGGNDYVHSVPTQKRGYRPGRKSQHRQSRPERKIEAPRDQNTFGLR